MVQWVRCFISLQGRELIRVCLRIRIKYYRAVAEEVFRYLARREPEYDGPRDWWGVWRLLEPVLVGTDAFSPDVREDLVFSLRPTDMGPSYDFEGYFATSVIGIIARPTNLQRETTTRVKEDVLPNLSSKDREALENIGLALRGRFDKMLLEGRLE